MASDIYPRPKQKNFAAYKLIAAELLFVLAIAIPVVVVLNYFRIINLPFLPQKPTVSEKRKQEIVAYEAQPILFACPIEAKLCANGKQLYDIKERRLSGFGFPYLPKGTKVLAVFDGSFTSESEQIDGKSVSIVTLTDTKNENVVIYRFVGSTSKVSGTVKQSEVIASTDDGTASLTNFNIAQYSLYVRVQNNITKQELPLKPSKDGKGLAL